MFSENIQSILSKKLDDSVKSVSEKQCEIDEYFPQNLYGIPSNTDLTFSIELKKQKELFDYDKRYREKRNSFLKIAHFLTINERLKYCFLVSIPNLLDDVSEDTLDSLINDLINSLSQHTTKINNDNLVSIRTIAK